MIVAIHPTQMYKSLANGSRISCTAILKACTSCCEKKPTTNKWDVTSKGMQPSKLSCETTTSLILLRAVHALSSCKNGLNVINRTGLIIT